MKKMLEIIALGLLSVGLTGCDAAEQSTQKLLEKAEQAAQDVAREAVDETLQQINKQVDEVQQSTNEWLGNPAEGTQQDETQNDQHQDREPVEPVDKTAVDT